mgnify:CR=1 FL=1
MKERIEQLAAGEVLVKKPELDFSPAYLEGRVEAGTVQNKELVIRVRNRVPFKGFFYSTNERVKIETKQAAGQSAAVLFEINTIDLKAGDEVILLGEEQGASITADEMAAMLKTIQHEVVCGIAPRVPKFYLEK